MNTQGQMPNGKEKKKNRKCISIPRIKTRLLYSFLLILLSMKLSIMNSQTPYDDPNHFILDTEDNFNSLNTNLWNNNPNFSWGQETYSPNNVIVSNGVLTLKCEKIGNTYVSGGVKTTGLRSFSYGYFEIESKTPLSGNKGPWGGFWMHTAEGGWDELDVLEPNGWDNYLGTQYNIGVSASNSGSHESFAKTITLSQDMSSSFHKYAVIWTPKYVQFLYDGVPVYEEVNPIYIPTHPMFVYLTFQIDINGNAPDSSTSFPLFWKFKHFKYYRLKTDCNTSIVQSNFDFINHDYKVYKSYSLSNSTVPNNSNIVLRAKDYILLNGEFTVPLGSTFMAITHNGVCPE